MSYKLTLTHDERQAIDWVGNRYAHGDELGLLLREWTEAEWDDEHDITFVLPEHVAWWIQDIGEEEEYRWTCFAPSFVHKLDQFVAGIV